MPIRFLNVAQEQIQAAKQRHGIEVGIGKRLQPVAGLLEEFRLANADLDPMPLLGCLDLLLGNVKDADRHFAVLRDPDLQAWFLNHPGDRLAAQCEYCRAWLERDVLPGYRDVDASGADLDAWFADRDVQGFVDRLDRKASPKIGAEEISLAWATAGDASLAASSGAAESDHDLSLIHI